MKPSSDGFADSWGTNFHWASACRNALSVLVAGSPHDFAHSNTPTLSPSSSPSFFSPMSVGSTSATSPNTRFTKSIRIGDER